MRVFVSRATGRLVAFENAARFGLRVAGVLSLDFENYGVTYRKYSPVFLSFRRHNLH